MNARALMVLFLSLCLGPLAFAAEPAALAPRATGAIEHPGYHEQPSWFKDSFLDLRADVTEAAAAHRRVILYFYQDGCPYCKKLLEDNFGQRAISDKTHKHFDVIAINMWGDREVTGLDGKTSTEKIFARTLKVMFTPTLLFLDERGGVVLRVNGYYPPHKFTTALDYVTRHRERDMSYHEYLAKYAPPPTHGALHQEPYFLKPPYRLVQTLRTGKGRLLVLFEQKQCAACDELHRDVFQRRETRALLDKFDVVLLDMWAPTPLQTPDGRDTTAAAWARTLNVDYAPAMVFFDRSGKEVFRAEAYLKAFHVQAALDYVASGAYLRQPSFQRYIEARADALRKRGVRIDLMK